MTTPGWYNEGKKLNEGEIYPFRFIKIIPLSDNMNYMLMEDPFGIRHLMPYEYYIQYNLLPGSMVNCRVDKINCTGRVFLEPEHPYYKTGSAFNFEITGFQDDAFQKTMRVITVRDVFGNEIYLEANDESLPMLQKGTLCCMVEGFKKGKPVLRIIQPGHKA